MCFVRLMNASIASGVEVQLVQAAAADLKAKIAWVSGSESELLSSLHERELDLVIGGLSRTSPLEAPGGSFRTLVAAGRTSNGGPLIPGAPWLLGARAGLNLDTRLGLFRLEYGVATRWHGSLLIRLGRIL